VKLGKVKSAAQKGGNVLEFGVEEESIFFQMLMQHRRKREKQRFQIFSGGGGRSCRLFTEINLVKVHGPSFLERGSKNT